MEETLPPTEMIRESTQESAPDVLVTVTETTSTIRTESEIRQEIETLEAQKTDLRTSYFAQRDDLNARIETLEASLIPVE